MSDRRRGASSPLPLQHRERPAGTSLFDLGQLDVRWEASTGTLWTHMTPVDRPNFNSADASRFPALAVRDQARVRRPADSGLRYLVLGSRFPGIFNLGGDLDLFAGFIAAGDREGLVSYGRACVSILHNNMRRLDLPLITIALVQGDALGGGFEAALSFNVIVAERGARFGLPEIAFGLFPGMGAHCLLSRKLGLARTEQMMLSNRLYSAEEMYEMGIVHVLAEPGCGEEAVRAYVAQQQPPPGRPSRHLPGLEPGRSDHARRASGGGRGLGGYSALPVGSDLKLMRRLVDAQARLACG